ncbi:MAG: beta-ketoacyl-ACP synthase III [Actinomycetota bacterium]
MNGAAITAWGTAIPSGELTNDDLVARIDVSREWIVERTGVRSRRIAAPGETTSTLAAAAASKALERAGKNPSDVDLIVVATATPDYSIPATAPLVQARIGANRSGAFDVGAGCAGFLYGLSVGTAMVRSEAARCVLVCGADTLSRVTDYTDRGTASLFGDGGGAVVVEPDAEHNYLGPFSLHSDGSGVDALQIPPGGDFIRMRGREVYRHAVEAMTASVREVLESADLGLADVDLLIAHQANQRILEAVAERLGLAPERCMSNIENFGNTSAASIPLALADAWSSGRIGRNDVLVLPAFGAGYAWGAGVVRWALEGARVASRDAILENAGV